MGQSEKMEQEDNRPKWLMELENRKRKPRLAHEVGAGAPCTKCNADCPGLDLHFWRKICKNCKCSRDDHDVPNDEFPQFDLLFGPTGKSNRKMIVLKVNKKQSEAEITFEWAPPDTTKELAEDYMKALPEDKLPIKGTAGAVLRKQQLQRQLPLHDIDHKVCDELSEFERKQFEKYLENLKKFVGQGKVIKAMGARPFDISLMTPANATDMKHLSPNHKNNSTKTNIPLNLCTPGSYIAQMNFLRSSGLLSKTVNGSIDPSTNRQTHDDTPSASCRLERVQSPSHVNSITSNASQGRYHRVLKNIPNNGETTTSQPVNGRRDFSSRLETIEKIATKDRSIPNDLKKSIDERSQKFPNFQTTNQIDDCNSRIESSFSNAIGNKSAGFTIQNDENEKLKTTNEDSNRTKLNPSFEQRYSNPNEIFGPTDSTSVKLNPEFTSPLRSNRETPDISKTLNSSSGKNFDGYEDSSIAEKILTEALKPPSAIHTADIVGSTLDRKGLSYIREKLISKYSTKDESTIVQSNPSRARDLNAGDVKSVGSRSIDDPRDRGAFNVSQATKNRRENDLQPSHPSSSRLEENRQGPANSFATIRTIGDDFSKIDVVPRNSTNIHDNGINVDNDPNDDSRKRIIREICDDYLTRDDDNDRVLTNDESNDFNGKFDHENCGSSKNFAITDLTTIGQPISAELTSYGPNNSNLIRSYGLGNPIFPEEACVTASSGITRNLGSVDRLRGAMEELNVSRTKIQNCHRCQEDVRPGDVVVTAERANDAVWHPGCFVCSECDELLADLVYFYYKGKLYCGRDLAKLLDIPRCFACDELIFVREYTVAEGHNYHVKHFCCWDCDEPLAGQQYISENDRPLCLPCYQRTYAQTCGTCQGLIAADQQGVAVKNLNFHATENCFCCATCKKSLLNGKMAIKEDRPFCSKECIAKFINERSS